MLVVCKCGKRLKVPDQFAGKKVRCPACSELVLAREEGGKEKQVAKAGVAKGIQSKPKPQPEPEENERPLARKKTRSVAEEETAQPKRPRSKKKRDQAPSFFKRYGLVLGISGAGVVAAVVIVIVMLNLGGGADRKPIQNAGINPQPQGQQPAPIPKTQPPVPGPTPQRQPPQQIPQQQPVNVPLPAKPEVVPLTAFDYCKEYKANDQATKTKYFNKILEITGTVRSADSMNSENTPEVTLVGSADKLGFDIVQCQFPMGNRNAILALVKGQTVKIQGKLFSDVFVPGAPLGDCKLIEAGSSPAIVVSALQLAKDYRENPQAASTKYNEKPLILEGTVVDIKPDEGKNCYTFTMAGPDAKAANPIRLNVDCRTLGQHHVRQLLETVKKGQTIKIKGEGLVSFSEFFKECKVIDAMLLD